MNSKAYAVVLTVVFTLGLVALVVEPIHAEVTCRASASAGRTSASGSVSPGIRYLEFQHSVNNQYSGTGTVMLKVAGTPSSKSASIYIKVKERTVEYLQRVERSATLEAGMSIGSNWSVFETDWHADGSRTVKYTMEVKRIEKELYTVSSGCSLSASGSYWQNKSASSSGSCGGASDSDGPKTYTYSSGSYTPPSWR